jgi:hypothetical protein
MKQEKCSNKNIHSRSSCSKETVSSKETEKLESSRGRWHMKLMIVNKI